MAPNLVTETSPEPSLAKSKLTFSGTNRKPFLYFVGTGRFRNSSDCGGRHALILRGGGKAILMRPSDPNATSSHLQWHKVRGKQSEAIKTATANGSKGFDAKQLLTKLVH